MALAPQREKWEAFGWTALQIDGHSAEALYEALSTHSDRPLAIIADTVKGKLVEENAVEFDFHTVLYREVKACKPDIYRKKGKAKKPSKSSGQAVKRSGSMTGFTMPGMGSAIGGMY